MMKTDWRVTWAGVILVINMVILEVDIFAEPAHVENIQDLYRFMRVFVEETIMAIWMAAFLILGAIDARGDE